jgi:hypothetical protein
MMDVAAAAFENSDATHDGTLDDGLRAALRAVAPMIAARARAQTNEASFGELQAAWVHRLNSVVAAEREACAKLVREFGDTPMLNHIANAIRARGETP